MSKFQINFAKYIPKPKRSRIELSPQDKFSRLARRLKNKGSKNQLRLHHYNVIEAGKEIIVFNGEGNEVIREENSFKGYRKVRLHCFHLFKESKNQNGGFQWTPNVNLEHQTLEELNLASKMTRKNLDFVIEKEEIEKAIKCNDCFFEFANKDEFNSHICKHGSKGFVIFDFMKGKIAA